tara:strand:- start:533 stop:733 length:201 start_codon:yes stop_codon:yes gene_type:complete
MYMTIEAKKFISATVKFVDRLDGLEKSEFIEDVFEDYEWICTTNYSLSEKRKYRELFTALVKNFGH